MDGMENMRLGGGRRRFDAMGGLGGLGMGEGLMGGLGGGGLGGIPEMSGGLGGGGFGGTLDAGMVGERVGGLRGLGGGLRGPQGRGVGGLGGGLGGGLRSGLGLEGLRGMQNGMGAGMSGTDMRPDLGTGLRRSPNPDAPCESEEETADNAAREKMNSIFEARAQEVQEAHFNSQRHPMMPESMAYRPQHALRRPAGLGAEGHDSRFHLQNARIELLARNLGSQPSPPYLQAGIGLQGQFDPYPRAAYSPFHQMNRMGGPPDAAMSGYETEMEAMQRQAAEAEMMARAGYGQCGQGHMCGPPAGMGSSRGGYFL